MFGEQPEVTSARNYQNSIREGTAVSSDESYETEEIPGEGGSRRDFLKRTGIVGGVILAGGGALAACGDDDGGTAPSMKAGGLATTIAPGTESLSVRTWGTYAGTLDPIECPSFLEFQTISPCYEGLIGWKPGTAEPVNLLAETFEASTDGTEFTFSLKEGILFQGGYGEVTAADVKFSLERAAASSAAAKDLGLKSLVGVEVTGDYSGIIRLSAPYGAFVGGSLTRWSGAIVSEAGFNDRGDNFKLRPVLTGPYEVTEFIPDAGVTLTRFDDYSGAADGLGTVGTFGELNYLVMRDANAATIAVESGELSYAMVGGKGAMQFKGDPGMRIDASPLMGWDLLGMNVNHAALQDVNLRMAVRWALDPQEIVDGSVEGLNEVTSNLIPEWMPGHWKDAPVYTRDVAKAKEYFAAAGSPSDELGIMAISAAPHKAAAEIIAAQLQEVGINAVVNIGESPDAQAWRRQNPASADSAFHFTTGIYLVADPSGPTEPYHGSRLGGSTVCFCDFAEYNRIWDEAAVEADNTKRMGMYSDLEQMFNEELMPAAILDKPTHWYAGVKTVNPVFSPLGFGLYHFFTGSA